MLRYQDLFSWLAMMLVGPAKSGAVIGTRLLKEGLMLLDDEACVSLDATPLGKPLYERPARRGWPTGQGLQGYCFGHPGYKYEQLGPIAAKNETIASELVSECLQHQNGCRFAIDIPTASSAWMARLASFGFEEERPFVRMRRGAYQHTGGCAEIFGIAGPEFG